MLTINDEKFTLEKQVAQLTEKSEEENYVIKGKLSEKERELELMKERLDAFERAEEAREEEMRRKIERTDKRLAEITEGWTDEMREIYKLISK